METTKIFSGRGVAVRKCAYKLMFEPVKAIFLDVRFEVFTAATMKNASFWDVAPSRSYVIRLIGGMYRLHLQCRKIRERGNSMSRSLHMAENRGDTFLRNVVSDKIYTAPHPRRLHSSYFY
jgi:hypothetical protein